MVMYTGSYESFFVLEGKLDCLQQFKEQVEMGNTGFCLPYRIDKGKIEDTASPPHAYSIKIQFNSEEHWTKALKYMLTNS